MNNISNAIYVFNNGLYEIKNITTLKEFIKEMMEIPTTENIKKNNHNTFELWRWSKDCNDWCVFACSHNSKENPITNNVSGFGGYYCIDKKESLNNVLSLLADSGWAVKIHSHFFN